MNIIRYQLWTRSTAVYPEAAKGTEREFNYLTHGVAGEAGEIAGKFKKLLRSGIVTLDAGRTLSLSPDHESMLLDEMGDTLWYLARLCEVLDTNLECLAQLNHDKLEARKAEGQLGSITR